MKEECAEVVTHKIIVFEEKKSKLSVENLKQVQVTKIKVDDCEIIEGLRCDYLFLAKELEHFVELKGQDLNHAYGQLRSTIQMLSKSPKLQKKVAIIICSRGTLSAASIQNEQARFKRNFSSDLIVKRSPYIYSL